MPGETAKCEALCLAIYPWSRTSHVVVWLTPSGIVKTVVKGAVRPKSFCLGQYDLNYVCQIVYYLRERGNLHALRECVPCKMREMLRGNFRALVLAGYVRSLVLELAAEGAESVAWYNLADDIVSRLEHCSSPCELLFCMVDFELEAMRLAGVMPDFSGYDPAAEWSAFSVASGSFADESAGRSLRIKTQTARWLESPSKSHDMQILLDASRVIGVFYQFHLDCAVETRREVLKLILQNDNEKV